MESRSEVHYHFQNGLPAFEQDKEFRLIAEPDWGPFAALESVRESGPRFICIEIPAVVRGYSIEINEEDAGTIGVQAGSYEAGQDGLKLLGILNNLEDGSLTANLAAPLVLNSSAHLGVQSIQPESLYSPFTIILSPQEWQVC